MTSDNPMGKTPRTDRFMNDRPHMDWRGPIAEFMRQLERELASAERRIEELVLTDDITMTAFTKLEDMFKQQVDRAESAERRIRNETIEECAKLCTEETFDGRFRHPGNYACRSAIRALANNQE